MSQVYVSIRGVHFPLLQHSRKHKVAPPNAPCRPPQYSPRLPVQALLGEQWNGQQIIQVIVQFHEQKTGLSITADSVLLEWHCASPVSSTGRWRRRGWNWCTLIRFASAHLWQYFIYFPLPWDFRYSISCKSSIHFDCHTSGRRLDLEAIEICSSSSNCPALFSVVNIVLFGVDVVYGKSKFRDGKSFKKNNAVYSGLMYAS